MTMNEAIEAADREADSAVKAAVKDLARKPCSRCGGKGYDYFLGGSRAPGVCFKCGGSGKVYASNAVAKVAAERLAPIELNRLRACWKAVKSALVEAKAEPSTWSTRSTVRELERKLAAYEKAGKEQATAAAASGKAIQQW